MTGTDWLMLFLASLSGALVGNAICRWLDKLINRRWW